MDGRAGDQSAHLLAGDDAGFGEPESDSLMSSDPIYSVRCRRPIAGAGRCNGGFAGCKLAGAHFRTRWFGLRCSAKERPQIKKKRPNVWT